jgi:acetolactate synthase-1/2/3 large subunit
MYTISALWTHVREGLDITTVISANDSYAFLGMGIPAPRYTCGRPRSPQPSRSRAATAEDLTDRLREAFTEPGPHLIEAAVPALF